MRKVTVKQFLNAGFVFVVGDEVYSRSITGNPCGRKVTNPIGWNIPSGKDHERFIKSLVPRQNTGTQPVPDDCVVEVTFRDGMTSKDPAGWFDWSIDDDDQNRGDIITWTPHLPSILEQQMNDNQESAMNIDECDADNAFIQQEGAAVVRELVESDEWVNGLPPVGCECLFKKQFESEDHYAKCYIVGTKPAANRHDEMWLVFSDNYDGLHQHHIGNGCYCFKELLTPEQLSAKEREDAAIDLYSNHCISLRHPVKDLRNNLELMGAWLEIVDKTGYRK